MSGEIIARAGLFESYFEMGEERSYQRLADQIGVAKRSIQRIATQEQWTERLQKIEAAARADTDRRLVESAKERNARHVRTARQIQRKALEALQTTKFRRAMDAVRALEIGVKTERLVYGDTTENMGLQEVLQGEYASLLRRVEESEPERN